jgi:type VII secretion-associated protein (TIGR03931 family)
VRPHVVEVGPNAIRRLCCGVGTVADSTMERLALECLDDVVALLDFHPVPVGSLWRSVLESVKCSDAESIIVIYPSWWPSSRVGVVSAAAQVLGGDVVMTPRSKLLRRTCRHPAIILEITDGFVVVTGEAVAAQTRRREQHGVAEAVVNSVLGMASGAVETVVIDAPRTVRGAGELSALIAEELRDSGGMVVMQIDDIEMRKLAAGLSPAESQHRHGGAPHVVSRRWTLAVLVSIVSVVLGVGALLCHSAPQARDAVATTYVVEGHVALEVPAQWPVRRVVAGPGSARLQISSPFDPEVALHVTQSRVALESLDATAEFLKEAIDAAPSGVFVDFNPAGRFVGRPVVTYREVRSTHDVRWTVWVDKAVRISIGCQSRRGHDEPVRQECDLAVRTARALM